MSRKLWRCRNCDILVDRFVNGNTCPGCGCRTSDRVPTRGLGS
ncbi:hypothetical protein [Halorubrum ezzemoulense]|nr:hypothetical protein [Halorubrum ezzemoulense]